MSFRELGLNRLICDNLTAMGYRQPRAIQAQAINPIINGRDLIGLDRRADRATSVQRFPGNLVSVQRQRNGHGALKERTQQTRRT